MQGEVQTKILFMQIIQDGLILLEDLRVSLLQARLEVIHLLRKNNFYIQDIY